MVNVGDDGDVNYLLHRPIIAEIDAKSDQGGRKQNIREQKEKNGNQRTDIRKTSYKIQFFVSPPPVFLLFLFLCFSFPACTTTEYNLATQQQETLLFNTEKEVNIGNSLALYVEKENEQEMLSLLDIDFKDYFTT